MQGEYAPEMADILVANRPGDLRDGVPPQLSDVEPRIRPLAWRVRVKPQQQPREIELMGRNRQTGNHHQYDHQYD